MGTPKGSVFLQSWEGADGKSKTSDTYHYRVQIDGKRYCGVTPHSQKRKALEWMRDEKIPELVKERAKEKMTSEFPVAKAFDLFMRKPRRRMMSEKREKLARAQWMDFVSFLSDRHPDIEAVGQVTKQVAEEYINYIRKNGRFSKEVEYSRGKRRRPIAYSAPVGRPAQSTANTYLVTMNAVFHHIAPDLGLEANPFSDCHRTVAHTEKRDVYEQDALDLVLKNTSGMLHDLFITGSRTGMDRKSICLLKRSMVSVETSPGWIKRTRDKSGAEIEIPLFPDLRAHLVRALAKDCKNPDYSEYVYPELAEMYLTNPSGITYRVKQLLNTLKLTNVRKPAGRSRNVSVLDVHSLRHTFCYLAGKNGWPLPTVQAWVGHMTASMTEHYMSHANKQDKVQAMEKMAGIEKDDPLVERLRSLDPESLAAILKRAGIDRSLSQS